MLKQTTNEPDRNPQDGNETKWGKWVNGLTKIGDTLSSVENAVPPAGGSAPLMGGANPSGADQLSPVVTKYMEYAKAQNPFSAWLQF